MTTDEPPSAADPARLRCPDCGTDYADRWRCECGAPLEFAATPLPDGPAPDPSTFDARNGLWSFDEFLPVGGDPADRVTLGEGMTPLVDADATAANSGGGGDADSSSGGDATAAEGSGDADGWNAAFKLEYVFPTGSFKDRGATTLLTRARELGVERVVDDSSGNAGAAIATYAARAGVDAEIYVPADVKEAKLRAIRRAGAEPVRVEGSRQDVTDACVRDVVETDAWYASHAWNPAFFAGTATFAHEIAYQRDWEAPDAVVSPLGHGTLFLGAYKGFRALERAGWIDEVPRLLGAQAAGVAPVVRELRGADAADPEGVLNDRDDVRPSSRRNDAADGIQIAEPVRLEQILDAITETDGDAIAVTEAATERELDRLHRAGFYTEPTSAVAPAALREYRDRGTLSEDDDVVVPLTGSGLKS